MLFGFVVGDGAAGRLEDDTGDIEDVKASERTATGTHERATPREDGHVGGVGGRNELSVEFAIALFGFGKICEADSAE